MIGQLFRIAAIVSLMVGVCASAGSLGCNAMSVGRAPDDSETTGDETDDDGTGESGTEPTPGSDIPSDDDSNSTMGDVDDGLNEPPIASASAVAGGGGDSVVLDGNGPGRVILDGRDSSDPDGMIVSWEWRIGGSAVALEDTATIEDIPVGVTRVTLVVTDDDGAKGFDEIDIINPGFRPGRWVGITAQGYEVSFIVTEDQRVTETAFGYAFNGVNLLNGAPCQAAEPTRRCATCDVSAERCAFSVSWQETGFFAMEGSCVRSGDPPFEFAQGIAAAAPSSNCNGSIDGLAWQANWLSDR